MNEYKNLEGSAYVLNPISNINGYLTSANEIFDLEQNLPQSELNKLIKLNSGVSEIQEFYAVYNSPSYGKNTEAELNEMITSIDWVRIPGGEFPKMTPDNPYLWNYEKFIQTNGDIVITLPHVTGILGRGYKSISRYYLVNNQSEEEPKADDTQWQTLSPPTTKENPYLWEKQEIYYTDNIEEATPDETIFTLIGVIGDPGIDGTQIEYIFCFSNSRLKAPNNPTPENWDKDMDFQKLDFIPYPRIEDFNEKRSDYYWSDEPVGISKDNPAQWICKREYTFNEEIGRVLWGKFSDPKLYSTYGEDGVSIVSIETWYLISASNTLTNTIKNAPLGDENSEEKEAEKWYKNSPSVNKENRYLWKKTITEYSAAIIDNPDTESDETKIKTSISYEVIGSMGDPGIDGDSVEWIYTRTITNKKPTIFTSINDSGASDIFTEEDFLGDDPTNSDYIPHPTSDDFSKNKTNYYWSDDIQSVDDTYIYGWRAQRKKTNGIWGSFSDPVKILYKAKDGVSPNASFKSIIFCRSEKDLNLTDESGKKLYTIPSEEVEINENTSYNTFNYPIPPSSKYSNTDINIVWSDGIPGGTEKLWSSTRIFSSDGKAPQQESWTEPKVMSDSTDIEIIYCAREKYIDPNNLGNIISENGELTEDANKKGWFDEPNQTKDDTEKTDVTPIWMAISRSVNGIWSNWEISKIKGERGNDGTSIKVSGHYDDLSTFKLFWGDKVKQDETTGETIVEKWYSPEDKGYTSDACFVVEGKLWVWNGSDKWIDVGQFKGDPGKTYYLHIIYAKSATTKDDGSFCVTESDLTDKSGIVPGKYIATWTDDKQEISITQDLLKSLIWSKWVGNDGYGYEYIYKLSKTETPEKLPLVPNDWKTNEEYQKPDYCPTDWSDNPLNVSKESPYCWQAYRIRVDGIWQQWQGHADTDAALWSKYGKDGKGINNIIYSFCINNENNYESFIKNLPDNNEDPEADNLPNSEEDIQSNHWYKNSPSVTEEYPCLWKKTITTYTEKNTDDTEGLETQTTYELIGVKGARGVDGNDIEWAFKLTSTFDQPTSKDSDWPTGEITSQVPGKWTDDAQEVSSEYPYQWVINRTKSNGEWTPWGTPVYIEGKNEPEYYKATLNNTYGNYIINSESYYKVSTSEKISSFVPKNSENLSLEDYRNLLIDDNYGWKRSADSNEILAPDPINDKLYEISILIFSDNTYSVSGPVVKGIWTGRDVQSTVFCRSDYVPATPTGGDYDNPWPENGTWSDGIPKRETGDSTTVWSSTAIFVPGGEGPKNGWSTPIQLTDTSSLQIRYYDGEVLPTDDNNNIIKPTSLIPDENNPNESIENWNKEWTETASQNTVWMATRSYSYGEWTDWTITKIKGEKGEDGESPTFNNLLDNSSFNKDSYGNIEHWNTNLGNPGELGISWINRAESGIGENSISIETIKFPNAADNVFVQDLKNNIGSKEERWWTLSFYAKGTTKLRINLDNYNPGTGGIYINGNQTDIDTNTSGIVSLSFRITDVWELYVITFRTRTAENEDIKYISKIGFGINTYFGSGKDLMISMPKLEMASDQNIPGNSKPTLGNLSKNDLVGPAGKSGKNMYPAGNWDSTRDYKIENNSVPFVFYNDAYYILTAESSGTGIENAPSSQSDKWGSFTYTPFQFSEFLMANWAKFGGKYGAVFYDRYLFSQRGHGNTEYQNFMEDNPMFNTDGNLSGSFIPKLHLDFYNGLANLSCLCEPYVTYSKDSKEFKDGVIEIDPQKGFNIKIECDSPSSYNSDFSLDMRHPIVILPQLNSTNSEEAKNTWAMDGSHITILFENGGVNYGKLSQLSNPEVNKQNIFLLVSVDDICLKYGINSGRGDYDSNYIYSNNRRGKYLIMSPGSMVKMKVNVIDAKDDYGNDVSYLYWVVENSGSVSSESVNVYSTSEEFNPESINTPRTLVKKDYSENNTTDIIGAISNTTLTPFHGADLTDAINLNSGVFLPENWGMMFYSGPKGFCPKNIVFSYGENGNKNFRYRALDFKGRVGSDGNVITLDNCIGFEWDPL